MATTIDPAQLHDRLDEYLRRAADGERILVRERSGRIVMLGPAERSGVALDIAGTVKRRRHRSARSITDVLAEGRGR